MAAGEGGPTGQPRLDSWKEIGTYFGRDERTVKRWERERGLPVHRVPGSGRGRVYAYRHELAEWLQSAEAALAAEITPSTGSDAHAVLTAAEIAAIRNATPPAARPPGPTYPTMGYRPSGDSSARMPDSTPRLSLVQRAAPSANAPPHVMDVPASGDVPATAAPSAEAVAAPPPQARHASWWIAGACAVILLAGTGAWWNHHSHLHAAQNVTDIAANAQAQNLYLQGRYFWQERTPDSLTKAVDLFTQAIVQDPHYAPAYAGLAECYELLREFSTMPDNEAFPRALSAAQQAVKLNPNLAQGHAALAFAEFYWSWNSRGALREFQRALQLDPDSAQTHHWYATSLIALGRGKEALQQIDRAQQLDPGSRAIIADKGFILMMVGRTEEARVLLQQVQQSDPGFVSPHQYLADLALRNGDGVEFARQMRQVATLLHDPARAQMADIAEAAYRSGGATAMTQALKNHTRDLYKEGKVSPVEMARILLVDGDRDGAFKLLDVAYARRDPALRGVTDDPAWSPYRSDPRFVDLETKLGVTATDLRPD